MIKRHVVVLDTKDRQFLLRFCSSRREPTVKCLRAWILLMADTRQANGGATDQEIHARLHVSLSTISRVRRRYAEEGVLAAIKRRAAKGHRQPVLKEDQVNFLLELTRHPPPHGHRHWTLRLLAEQMVKKGYAEDVSHETIRQVLLREAKSQQAS